MGCHPSHWRTHIFQDGVETTNQSSYHPGAACFRVRGCWTKIATARGPPSSNRWQSCRQEQWRPLRMRISSWFEPWASNQKGIHGDNPLVVTKSLRTWNIAIEIGDVPIKSMVICHSYVSLPEGNHWMLWMIWHIWLMMLQIHDSFLACTIELGMSPWSMNWWILFNQPVDISEIYLGILSARIRMKPMDSGISCRIKGDI